MRFDGPTFAHSFLAVFTAASTSKDSPTFKTIALREHLYGIRLVATDGRLMLTTWVPNLENHYEPAPAWDTDPEQVVVVSDADARGRGLMGYICSLANRIPAADYAPGRIEIAVDFHKRLPAGAEGNQETLEGMEATYTVLSVPDTEKVHLEIVPIGYPNPGPALAKHTPTKSPKIVVDPELLERLTKVRKHADGDLRMVLGKTSHRVAFDNSDPWVEGLIALPLTDPADEPSGLDVEVKLANIDDNLVTCPEPECSAEWDATEDGDAALSEAVRHLASDHGIHNTDVALRRIHGLPDETIQAIADGVDLATATGFLGAVDPPSTTTAATSDEEPDLVKHALELVVGTQFGSARMLQRKLSISWARADALMGHLERHGVVGPTDGRKARDVLILPNQIAQAVASITGTDQS